MAIMIAWIRSAAAIPSLRPRRTCERTPPSDDRPMAIPQLHEALIALVERAGPSAGVTEGIVGLGYSRVLRTHVAVDAGQIIACALAHHRFLSTAVRPLRRRTQISLVRCLS
jgi:hypothetical protein